MCAAVRCGLIAESTPSLKSQIVIRRPAHAHAHTKSHRPRVPLLDDEPEPEVAGTGTGEPEAGPSEVPTFSQPPDDDDMSMSDDIPGLNHAPSEEPDELARIRALLRPPPIRGVDDWGIPPEPQGACDPEIEVRVFIRSTSSCSTGWRN